MGLGLIRVYVSGRCPQRGLVVSVYVLRDNVGIGHDRIVVGREPIDRCHLRHRYRSLLCGYCVLANKSRLLAIRHMGRGIRH